LKAILSSTPHLYRSLVSSPSCCCRLDAAFTDTSFALASIIGKSVGDPYAAVSNLGPIFHSPGAFRNLAAIGGFCAYICVSCRSSNCGKSTVV